MLKIMRISEVMYLTKLSKPTVYRRVKDGTFPHPVKLGVRATGWKSTDIQKWIDELIYSDMTPITDESRKRQGVA